MKQITLRQILMLFALVLLLGCSSDKDENATLAVPEFKFTSTSPTVYGGADGAIVTEEVKSVPPTYYFWSNGATTKDVTGLTAGTYTLKVLYGDAGVGTYTVLISPLAPPKITITSKIVIATSYSATDGSVAITKIEGTSLKGTPTYSWKNGFGYGQQETAISTSAKVSAVSSGWYVCTIKDIYTPTNTEIVQIDSFFVGQPDFVCGNRLGTGDFTNSSIKDVDNYLYKTIWIGGKCWMQENLKTEHYPNNKTALIAGRFKSSVYEGAHYSWTDMMAGTEAVLSTDTITKIQGICPKGWHVPTEFEWNKMRTAVGTNPADKMRGIGSSSMFNALTENIYGYKPSKEGGYFWTATNDVLNSTMAKSKDVVTGNPDVATESFSKVFGLSVRCVQD